jgi:hypothetical protein
MRINRQGFLERDISSHKNNSASCSSRVWYLVHEDAKGYGFVVLGRQTRVYFPKEFIGQKVCFRMELFVTPMISSFLYTVSSPLCSGKEVLAEKAKGF